METLKDEKGIARRLGKRKRMGKGRDTKVAAGG
jgi:hypothetical protein